MPSKRYRLLVSVFILSFGNSGGFITKLGGSGRIILASYQKNEWYYYYNFLKNDVFTSYIVDAINDFDTSDANHDYSLSAEEIFNYASKNTVAYNATYEIHDQNPIIDDQYSGDLPLISKFVFNTNIGLPAGSTIVTIDGTNYKSIPAPFYWVPGRSHDVSVPAQIGGSTGTRYTFTNWNGGDTGVSKSVTSGSLTAYYNKEYLLTITSAFDTPTGGGWYVDGTTASFSVTAKLETSNTKRTFIGWSGDFTGAASSVP